MAARVQITVGDNPVHTVTVTDEEEGRQEALAMSRRYIGTAHARCEVAVEYYMNGETHYMDPELMWRTDGDGRLHMTW